MPPGEMLRVGMGALVALSGLAVMETLQVTLIVCDRVTEPDPDTLPELGEKDWAKLGEATATEASAAAAMTGALRLYPKLGYTETDRRVDQGFQRVFFRKTL